MMKYLAILAALNLVTSSLFAKDLEKGNYTLVFNISDMMFFQELEISNIRKDVHVEYFDITVKAPGSLNRNKNREMLLQGRIEAGKFSFIIPQIDHNGASAFFFEGQYDPEEALYSGHGDVPGQGPNCGSNKYKFSLIPKDVPEQLRMKLQSLEGRLEKASEQLLNEHGLYIIKPKDRIWTVASKFKLTVEELKELNPGLETNHFRSGMVIRVKKIENQSAHTTPASAPR